jgi:hypothetical protein
MLTRNSGFNRAHFCVSKLFFKKLSGEFCSFAILTVVVAKGENTSPPLQKGGENVKPYSHEVHKQHAFTDWGDTQRKLSAHRPRNKKPHSKTIIAVTIDLTDRLTNAVTFASPSGFGGLAKHSVIVPAPTAFFGAFGFNPRPSSQ